MDKPPRSRLEKVTKQTGKFKDTLLYVFVVAGGLIVALAWRDTVQSFFEKHFAKNKEDVVRVTFMYAVIVTTVLIIGLYLLAQFTRKK